MTVQAIQLVALLVMAAPAATADTVASVEAAALANRRAVRTVVALFRCDYRSHWDATRSRRTEARVWMDGARLRTDHADHHPSLGEQAGKRFVECHHCERNGYHLLYPEIKHVVLTLEPVKGTGFTPHWPTFDPRLVGYVPINYAGLVRERLDSFVGRADRLNPRLSSEPWEGAECRVVRYTITASKAPVEVWYDPAKGFHPVRLKIEVSGVRQEVTVEVQPAGPGLWFPRTVKYTQHIGEKLAIEELVEVSSVQINQPIPPATFTLAGIGVADGTHVYIRGEPPLRDAWVWRGGKLVLYEDILKERAARGELPPEPEPVPLAEVARTRYWMYGLAAGLFAIACGLLWRLGRRPG